jgi:alcohol dehydrogenase class IV
MVTRKKQAKKLLKEFKNDHFAFGLDCINKTGEFAKKFGRKVSLVALSPNKDWSKPAREAVLSSLKKNGLELAGEIIPGASPNAPVEDVFIICNGIKAQNPDVVVSLGAGSSIDATKAAVAYLILSDKYPELNDYFGMNQVTNMLQETGRELLPVVAVQVTSGSAAHLTKYSNITDMEAGQKMLIVDEAIVPPRAVFDYRFSASQSKDLTMDGALDGISHCLEVLMGIPEDKFKKASSICLSGIELIVNNLKKAVENPDDLEAREAIGLGTDLGGYAIMIGGTNGAHLNSFSMTDILAHGRACAVMNPYYVVFFSTAIESRLRKVGKIYKKAGYISANLKNLSGRDLGMAVSEGMTNLSLDIGFPTKLLDVPGFNNGHIKRCLTAAKNPRLESKLKNMPVPLSADTVDEYMEPVLLAAKTGDKNLIKNYSMKN